MFLKNISISLQNFFVNDYLILAQDTLENYARHLAHDFIIFFCFYKTL